MKTAEQSVIDFLKANPSRWASGDLQRMGFRNKNGTLATPRSIVRRLEENAIEGGVLQVSYDAHGGAQYQIKEEYKPKPTLIIDESKPPIKDENGRWRPQFTFEVLSPNPSSSSSMTRL